MENQHFTTALPSPTEDDPRLQRIEASNALEPGQYWRAIKQASARVISKYATNDVQLRVGDIHLVSRLFDFEGTLHSVHFLEHPRNAGTRFDTLTMLAADFFAVFEPVPLTEAKAIRAEEQSRIVEQVQAMQQEVLAVQTNPLQLPEVRKAAEAAVEAFERNETARVQSEVHDRMQKESDLRRIHRRAARRSELKGNPLVVRKTTITDRLDVMIAEGVSSDSVRELQLEAGRRQAIAEATNSWLMRRDRHVSDVLKQLAPYAIEQGQLLLAAGSDAIERLRSLDAGITSLKLYTGEGVDVFTVREGSEAPSYEPLTIVQGKLAMDEELAVFVDVADSFDCSSQDGFFRLLAKDDRLIEQIFPTPRCVVSMQVTRRRIHYSRDTHPFVALRNELANKRVFLLVRNGSNVHAVYSGEPSHEAAERLFPTREDLKSPFRGLDGSTIGLNDVAFSDAAGRFEDQALHYRRFLILLCGLDHRLNLFGDFAPPESKLSFMSQAFQQRYLRFLENDDPGLLLGEELEPVSSWFKRHNAQLRSGSRVVPDSASTLLQHIPFATRSSDVSIDQQALHGVALIAAEKDGELYLPVPTLTERGSRIAKAWLTGAQARDQDGRWYLCIDRVDLEEVRRYIYSRQQRIGSIRWIRTLRRVEQTLIADQQAQTEVRQHMRQAALAAGIHTVDDIDEALDEAIAAWRADHRGAQIPALSDKKGMSQLLSLVFPAENLATSMRPLIDELCSKHGLEPLMATRTGKNKLALYCVAPPSDRVPYSSGVVWGWVRRYTLQVSGRGAKLGYNTLVWLQSKSLDTTEETFLRWPALDTWVHEEPEPIKRAGLLKAKGQIAEGNALLLELETTRRSRTSLRYDLFMGWLQRIRESAADLVYTQHFYLSVPIAIYQHKRDAPPMFAYARMDIVDLVRQYGSQDQLAQLLETKGMRSAQMRHRARAPKHVTWVARVASSLELGWLQREGELRPSAHPSWALLSSHARGGVKRKDRTGKRAERRADGGNPLHREVKSVLSWSRSIDQLMGIRPLESRAFYRSTAERVQSIWRGFDTSDAVLKAKRKAEQTRRFEVERPLAFEVAPCLWDSVHQRSVANAVLSAKHHTEGPKK